MFAWILSLFLIVPSLVWAQSAPAKDPLPYQDEITKIISSLEYSGFEVVTRPDVVLSLDFTQRAWMLTNIHHYDKDGGIILEQGRYGLCAELSTYVYQKLRPIIAKQYDLKFAMVTETGFFPTYQSNHIVLLMSDNTSTNVYLIDPSFQKYGNVKDFKEYQFIGIQDALSFMKYKSPDVVFFVDNAMPLFIKDDLMLSLSVTSVDGKFDRDNFLMVVSVNQRNKISGMNILILGKYNGQIETFEGRELLEHLFNQKEINNLYRKLEDWMKHI